MKHGHACHVSKSHHLPSIVTGNVTLCGVCYVVKGCCASSSNCFSGRHHAGTTPAATGWLCLPASVLAHNSKFMQTPVKWNGKHPMCASLDGKACWKDTTIPCNKVRCSSSCSSSNQAKRALQLLEDKGTLTTSWGWIKQISMPTPLPDRAASQKLQLINAGKHISTISCGPQVRLGYMP